MSKLEELITELCPNGVPYYELGAIGSIIRGSGLQKKDLTEQGVGCIHYGQIYTYYNLFAYSTKSFVNSELAKSLKTVSQGNLVIAITSENVEDVCKCVAWLGQEDIVTGGHAAIYKHSQNPMFLAYYFQTETFQQQKRKIANGTKVIEVSPKNLSKVLIPVPPLPIQEEIVRILDTFTDLTEELSEELSEELAVRKRQYEYYRSYLFTTEKWNVPFKWHSIDSICKKITSGGTPSANTPSYYGGNIPWLRTQEINWGVITNTIVKITEQGLLNSSAKWIPPNCVIIAMYGATAGKVAINKIPLTTNQACCNLEIDEEIASYRYVFHWLAKEYINIKSLGQGSQSNINAKIVKDYEIPIPNIKVQNSIVNILDHFNTLSNDLTSCLPVEIEARKKQYEYYRDKLLTFKELKQ